MKLKAISKDIVRFLGYFFFLFSSLNSSLGYGHYFSDEVLKSVEKHSSESPFQTDQAVTNGTATDQDGNFRVGRLFNVEQSTGSASLNTSAFSLAGLQELSLGAVGLGQGGAVINEFSTDGTFSANSDNVVPTQRAIITYINSQIGGGSSSLNVNAVTAGKINITGNTISTTDNSPITVTTGMNFNGGVSGSPVAFAFFLTSKT